jgi:hypothetical protein
MIMTIRFNNWTRIPACLNGSFKLSPRYPHAIRLQLFPQSRRPLSTITRLTQVKDRRCHCFMHLHRRWNIPRERLFMHTVGLIKRGTHLLLPKLPQRRSLPRRRKTLLLPSPRLHSLRIKTHKLLCYWPNPIITTLPRAPHHGALGLMVWPIFLPKVQRLVTLDTRHPLYSTLPLHQFSNSNKHMAPDLTRLIPILQALLLTLHSL